MLCVCVARILRFSRCWHGKWKMRYAHIQHELWMALCSFFCRYSNAIHMRVCDDDGWRAFYWNFYVGTGSCGGPCICMRNTWHTKRDSSQRQKKPNESTPLSPPHILRAAESVKFWFCNLLKCDGYYSKMKIIFCVLLCVHNVRVHIRDYIAFGNGGDYLFTEFVRLQHVSQIHGLIARPPKQEPKALKMPIKFSSPHGGKNGHALLNRRAECARDGRNGNWKTKKKGIV